MSNSARRYISQSRKLLDQDHPEEAAALLRKAVAERPNDGYCHSMLGHALWEAGHREEAIAACKNAVRLDADLECPRLILSFHLRELGRAEEAIEVLREGIAACPRSHPTWLCQVANIQAQAGNVAQTIATYDELLTFAPNHKSARLERARLALGREAVFQVVIYKDATRWDEIELEPSTTRMREVLDALDRDGGETHSVSLNHVTNWSLHAYRGGRLVWENQLAEAEPRHLATVPRERICRLWLALAAGRIVEIEAEPWLPGAED